MRECSGLESSPGSCGKQQSSASPCPGKYFAAELETNKLALEEIRQALKDPPHDSGPHAGLWTAHPPVAFSPAALLPIG